HRSIDPSLSPLPRSATFLPFVCISPTNGSPATCIDLHRGGGGEECSNSPTYPRRSICDHATTPPPPNGTTAGVALSNDDLINGDTLLAVDGMRCPLTRSFQRLSAPAEEFLFLFHTKSCSMLQE
ncbi:Serine/threonine-protein kinase atg1, partial [Dissostichus eleginoides]